MQVGMGGEAKGFIIHQSISVMIFEFIFAMILYRKIKAIITLKIFAKNKVSGPIIVFRYAQKSNKNHYLKSLEYTPSSFIIHNS